MRLPGTTIADALTIFSVSIPPPRRFPMRGEEFGMLQQEVSMHEKPTAQLEGWQLLTLHGRPHQLIGFATDHPHLPGHRRFIQTSRILSVSDDLAAAETLNTVYRLHRPVTDMRFDQAFPVFISIADLVAERVVGEHWQISRGGKILCDAIPGYQAAILCMLDLLDRRGH